MSRHQSKIFDCSTFDVGMFENVRMRLVTSKVSAVPSGLSRNTRWCPGTEVPGYYRAAPSGREDHVFQMACEVELNVPIVE